MVLRLKRGPHKSAHYSPMCLTANCHGPHSNPTEDITNYIKAQMMTPLFIRLQLSSADIRNQDTKIFKEPKPPSFSSMGPKKKNSTTSSSSLPSDVDICEQALEFFRTENFKKADRLLKKASHRLSSLAIYHRIYAVIHFFCSQDPSDPKPKESRHKDAMASARRAIQLSPNNLEFSFYYVKLLLILHEYEEGIKECERALAVTNPNEFSIICFDTFKLKEVRQDNASYQEEFRKILMNITEGNIKIQESDFGNQSNSPSAAADVQFKKMGVEDLQDLRMAKIQSYLESLVEEDWGHLLQVKVEDVRKLASSTVSNIVSSDDLMKQALDWFNAHKKWEFLVCPRCCNKKYIDSESQLQHVKTMHLKKLSEELKPKEIDKDWVDKLVRGSWDPIDVQALTMNDGTEWPLSADTGRKLLLKRIKGYIWILFKENCLSREHVNKVLSDAMRELRFVSSAVQKLILGTNDSHSMVCIRFLDSSKLQKIINFFDELMQACKLGSYAKSCGPSSDVVLDGTESEEGIRALLDDSLLHIDLDLKLLSKRYSNKNADTSCPDDESRSSPDVDSVLYWLYEDQKTFKNFDHWGTQILERANQADDMLKIAEKEYENLHAIYIEKHQLLDYLDDLQFMKCQPEKKPKKGENSEELIHNWWFEKLDRRKQKGNHIVFEERADDITRLITEVLQEAKAFKASTNGDDRKFESDSNVDDNKRTTSLDNSCIDAGIQKVEESIGVKLCIIDARIMKSCASVKKLERNFVHTSVINYLAAIMPLLQTYLRTTIEEKAEEFAKREFEAAKNASFDEFLKDAQKNIDKSDKRQKSKGSSSKKSKVARSFK